jgi:hypothetical protein
MAFLYIFSINGQHLRTYDRAEAVEFFKDLLRDLCDRPDNMNSVYVCGLKNGFPKVYKLVERHYYVQNAEIVRFK